MHTIYWHPSVVKNLSHFFINQFTILHYGMYLQNKHIDGNFKWRHHSPVQGQRSWPPSGGTGARVTQWGHTWRSRLFPRSEPAGTSIIKLLIGYSFMQNSLQGNIFWASSGIHIWW